MLRSNHYDVAFEAWLREQRLPYVAVDERRRALLVQQSLKSPDFLVHSPVCGPVVLDVKGRKQLSGAQQRRWENWATHDDLASLDAWEKIFGGGFKSLLVFAYELADPDALSPQPTMLRFHDRRYSFYGVWASDYRQAMRDRSSRWETVWVPSARYRALRFPLDRLIRSEAQAV
ncbi:MAG: HYExAFE family protein [Planctomycetaceae bacterium]